MEIRGFCTSFPLLHCREGNHGRETSPREGFAQSGSALTSISHSHTLLHLPREKYLLLSCLSTCLYLLTLSFPLSQFLSSPFAGTGPFLRASNTQTWVRYSWCLTTEFFIVLALQSSIPWVYFTEKMHFLLGEMGLSRWEEDGGYNKVTKCLLVCCV